MMVTETEEVLRGDAWRMECLQAVESLHLPDWYVAAGFLRNAIWDLLHEKPERTSLNDVDVVYHDAADLSIKTEDDIQSLLRAIFPDANWEIRNQARMHLRNHHPPYRNTEHAIAHWPETQTCVGARIEPDGNLKIAAPYGIAENWSLRVTPNPVVPYPAALFNERMRSKRWLEHWPKLHVEWAKEL